MRKITDNLREKARENIEENPELFLVKIRVDFRVSCDDEIPSPLAFGLFDGIWVQKGKHRQETPRNKG